MTSSAFNAGLLALVFGVLRDSTSIAVDALPLGLVAPDRQLLGEWPRAWEFKDPKDSDISAWVELTSDELTVWYVVGSAAGEVWIRAEDEEYEELLGLVTERLKATRATRAEEVLCER
ncbi:MAG: hypothetical protein EON58_05300 [Alphaproteobacteria bacterium]|nr:MAG: hypothetical protein EON58_05300 [Alphaproteobacteria bacterium]